jgi:hypothetical protein
VTNDGTSILLNRIESMNIFRNNIESVVDKLKDDITFSVIMMSGKEHIISLNYFREKLGTHIDCDNIELLHSIYGAWERIHTNN